MSMYDIPTDGCNLEIMGYPFFAEKVSANEAFRRREMNVNNVVGGTQIVNKGAYVGLDFTITTHVFVDPMRPDIHNTIFQEMMSKPVDVVSPELGGKFKAMVVIKPEHTNLNSLELSINIKEIPDSKSQIPGESFTIPKSRKVETKKVKKTTTKKSTTSKSSKTKSKKKSVSKKTKSVSKKLTQAMKNV